MKDGWSMAKWQETSPVYKDEKGAVCEIVGLKGQTSVRAALWIKIVTAGQLAELSRLTFCTFQLISMEPHSPSVYSQERIF